MQIILIWINIKKQMDGLDIDNKKMNKVFGEIDIEKAFNLCKNIKFIWCYGKSLSKIKNIQPFTNYKENCIIK